MYACEGTHDACCCNGYPQQDDPNCPMQLLDFVIEHELVRFTVTGDVALIAFVAWSDAEAHNKAAENIWQGLAPIPEWGAGNTSPGLRVLRADEAGFSKYQAVFTDVTHRTHGRWILIVECAQQAEIASQPPLIVFQCATNNQLLDNLPSTEIPTLEPGSTRSK